MRIKNFVLGGWKRMKWKKKCRKCRKFTLNRTKIHEMVKILYTIEEQQYEKLIKTCNCKLIDELEMIMVEKVLALNYLKIYLWGFSYFFLWIFTKCRIFGENATLFVNPSFSGLGKTKKKKCFEIQIQIQFNSSGVQSVIVTCPKPLVFWFL